MDDRYTLTPVHGPGDWCRLLLGLTIVFSAFHWSATALGSERGEAGVAIGGTVVVLIFLVERLIFGQSWIGIARGLGLGWPAPKGLIVAGTVAVALLMAGVAGARTQSIDLSLEPGWPARLPGLFAQAGIAEEVLFRGYLFGHLRGGRSFRRAAAASMAPFAAVHLLMFLTLPWPIAVAAVALALVVSWPLAYLYELGDRTIWAPALVHFVIQGAVKVMTAAHDPTAFALIWMAASAAVPMLVFRVRPLRPS